MKRIVLLLLCICAYANSSKAGNVSHDVEFARAYGIIRYFSPNPYTQNWSENDWMKVCALLVQRAERQPLAEVFRPLAPSIFISATPVPPGVGDATPNDKARCYVYSGSGHLDVPFLARLLVPGLADYIPYHKELKSVSDPQDSIAKPAADRYYSYRLARGNSCISSMRCPGKILTPKQRSVCYAMRSVTGKTTKAATRRCPKGDASSSVCSRIRPSGLPIWWFAGTSSATSIPITGRSASTETGSWRSS